MYVAMNQTVWESLERLGGLSVVEYTWIDLRGKDDRGESPKHHLEGGREDSCIEQISTRQCARVSLCHIER